MKLIVDAATGTVLDIADCYFVDAEIFDLGEDTLSDSEIAEIAREHGTSVYEVGQNTGWGDNKYRYSVSYSPMSLKDEAISMTECGNNDPAVVWAATKATDEQFQEIADEIMSDDDLWNGYGDRVIQAITAYYEQGNEEI